MIIKVALSGFFLFASYPSGECGVGRINVKETVFGTRACLTIVGQGMQRQRYVRLDSR